jgi:hypothetical protein
MSARTKIRDEYRKGENDKLDRHWRTLFLDTLAETSNVSAAARKAGINPSRAYKVRREEPEFAAKWGDGMLEGYQHLEMETLHRLRMGVAAGKEDKKFDIANALRLLTLHRDTVARMRALEEEGDEQDILYSIDEMIDQMRVLPFPHWWPPLSLAEFYPQFDPDAASSRAVVSE